MLMDNISVNKTWQYEHLRAVDALAENSNGFSGAEIEMVIVEARYKAFDADREFVTEDILGSLTSQVPLSTTMAEDIGALRQWALKRARPAA
ncbi:hypothetical protein MNBD_NITROSPINAE03-457 [hydrothermal vent metagenome]|uniref:AAA ATPase AAA+ lid domain-containing protein n=1 Tax=hydrothermal vent metagenome TaxID=652676 RepID=A0A3B1BTC9_9ZZZZ